MIEWKQTWRTIQLNGGKITYSRFLSKDNALTHFCFCKVHLHEVADKLWPRLQCFIRGHRGSIKVNNGTYSPPYNTILLLVLYRLSRPRHIRKEMEGFFGIHKSKNQVGLHIWFMSCMHWECSTLTILLFFRTGCHNMLRERVYQKCGLVETVWGFLERTLCKTCHPSLFQKLRYTGHK